MRSSAFAWSGLLFILTTLGMLAYATSAYAHEVYVLSPEEVARAIEAPAMPPWPVIAANASQFLFWAFVTAVIVSTVFAMSISRRLIDAARPALMRAKTYAPLIARLGGGAAFLSFALEGALFGPELSMGRLFGAFALPLQFALGAAGIALLFGYYTRLAAALGLAAYVAAFAREGSYLLTYIEYAGLLVFLALESTSARTAGWLQRLYAMRWGIMRAAFGFSIMYASLYAKFLHNSLALSVVEKYDLTSYALFAPFSPEFVVLGAAIIEFLAGFLLLLGIEIRHTALFLIFWLTLSMLFFREALWPHIILFALAGAFLLYGYDRFSAVGWLFGNRGRREPVL